MRCLHSTHRFNNPIANKEEKKIRLLIEFLDVWIEHSKLIGVSDAKKVKKTPSEEEREKRSESKGDEG